MKAGILVRRLERLEAEFAPTDDSDVLRVTVTRIGEPDKIIEVRSGKPKSLGPR